MQPPTTNAIVTALRFFFKVTLDRPETTRHLVFVYEPRKLPRVLSRRGVAPAGGRTGTQAQNLPANRAGQRVAAASRVPDGVQARSKAGGPRGGNRQLVARALALHAHPDRHRSKFWTSSRPSGKS